MQETVDIAQPVFRLKEKCDVHGLSQVVEEYFPHIECLSLDCFDTIIWRYVAKPTDIFYLLAETPLFKKFAISAEMRVALEETARRRKQVEHKTKEVSLVEIYRAYSRQMSEDDIKALIKAEIEMELSFSYGFPPIIALMQAAIDHHKKIIIVSDTYFSKKEIKLLLQKHLPAHIVNHLTIYVSSEIGKSKTEGMHAEILKQTKLDPSVCLHIGDSLYADYKAPSKYGLYALHFMVHDESIQKNHRMKNLGLSLVDGEVHHSAPIYHPFGSIFASKKLGDHSNEKCLGYVTLGPMMYAFASYISQEAEQLKAQHQKAKLLFLLRDANLPKKIVNIINPALETYAVRISRFAAYASSFCSKQDVVDYVASVIAGERYKDICKQLQLPLTMIDEVLQEEDLKERRRLFEKLILKSENIALIISQSSKYRKRLMRYLKREAHVQSGDTLIFVDLGYSGTTQSRLAPILKKEYDITVVGRYLISLSVTEWQHSRAGLLDPTYYNEKLLLTLVAYVAMLEQLCTTVDKSVVDFDEQGDPIFSDVSLNADQYEKLTRIQQQCEQFAMDAKCLPLNEQVLSPAVMRQVALAEIIRLIYFPMQDELSYLSSFKFDLNLGTKDLIEMYSAEKGLDGLQRRGLFFMEKHAKSMRTNYPAELRANSLELAITMLAQHRYGLAFTSVDMSFRSQVMPVYVLQQNSHSRHLIHAHPTHDGYFSLIVPLGKGQYATGISIGEQYKWVQIKAIELIPVKDLYTDTESLKTENIIEEVVFDQIKCREGDLYECLSKAALLLVQPLAKLATNDVVCRLTFRPIV